MDHPEISPDDYTRAKRVELGRNIGSLHRVYLDTKFWIYLRDAAIGQAAKTSHGKLLELLRKLRIDNRVICPVSYSVFAEMMRQDVTSRRHTARLIDELGAGCCIQPPHVLLEVELLYFVRGLLTPEAKLLPRGQAVWTKVAFFLGDHFCQLVPRDLHQPVPDFAAAMTKAMDDVLWSIPVEVFAMSVDAELYGQHAKQADELAKKMTEGKFSHAHECKNIDELYVSEVYGGLEAVRGRLADLMLYLCRDLGYVGTPTSEELEKAGTEFARFMTNVVRLKPDEAKMKLPQVHLSAMLHAMLRWDKQRKYKANDLEDFRHATCALPYFNCFLTEKSLSHLLTQNPLRAADVYGSRVIFDEDEAIQHLVSIS